MAVKFANLASTTLASATTNSATSLTVSDASSFPSLGGGDYFYASIGEGLTSEIVKVTAVSSNTLTVTRGQDGTTAAAYSTGTVVALRVVAAALDDIASQAQTAADTESVSIDGDTMTGSLTTPGLTVNGNAILGSTASNYDQYVRGNSNVGLRIQTNAQGITSGDGMRIGLNGVHGFLWQFEALPLAFATSGTERLSISATGGFDFKGNTISSGAITVTGGNAQSVIKSSSDAPLIVESTDAYSGINFKDTDGNSSMYYRGTNDHLYLHSAKFSVAGSTIANGYQFQVNGSANLTGSLAIGGTQVIAATTLNLTNIGTISSGAVSSSGSYTVPNTSQNGLKSANGNNFFLPLDQYNNMHIRSTTGSEYHDSSAYFFRKVDQTEIFRITGSGVDVRLGTLAVNGSTAIDSSRNITAGAITASGLITTSNSLHLGSGYNLSWGGAYGSGKPTIAANTNTIYFYPTGNVSGPRLYLNATGLVNAGSFTSGALSVSGVHSGGFDVANLYSAATQANVNIGRSSEQRFNFYVTDAGGFIRYYQDETDGTDHSVHFQIQSSSSGTNQFYFNKGVNVTGNLSATSYSGNLASSVTGTTQTASDNSTKVATTAYVTTAVDNIVSAAPGSLDTLNELAAALGDDANFSTTVTNSIATKLPLAGGTLTGNLAIGNGTARRELKIRSNSYAEIQYSIKHSNNSNIETEYMRAGVAVTSTNFGQVIGDYYLYTPQSGKMLLTVPQNGDPLKRNNGAITIIDTTNYDDYALPLAGGTLTGRVTFPTGSTTKPILAEGFFARTTSDTTGTHDIWGISGQYNPSASSAADQYGIQWSGSSDEINFIGAGQKKLSIDLDTAGNVEIDGNRIWDAGDFTSTNISNWNTAYGWGDHSTQGYITNATASLNADKITAGVLNHARIPIPVNGDWWNGGFVKVQTDGVMEVGKYLDFHTSDSGGNTDFDVRVTATAGAIDIGGDLTVDDISSGAITSSDGIFGSTSGSNQGIQIKSGTTSSDYGRIRYYEGASTQRNTIHFFGRSWQSGTISGHSTGAINLDGDYGVTFGAWTNIDGWVDSLGIHTSATRSYYVGATEVLDHNRTLMNIVSFDTDIKVPRDHKLYFQDGNHTTGNRISAGLYPSQGYTGTSTFWIEYAAKGGHNFIVNTDGGSTGSENTFDHFTIWQGAVDGRKLFHVTNSNGHVFSRGSFYPSNQTTNYVDSTRISNWNTAYGWGDHSTAGYLTSTGTSTFDGIIVDGDDNAEATSWGTAPTAIIGGFSSGIHDGANQLTDFRMAVISKDTNGGNTPVMQRNQAWVTGGISGEAYNSAARWDLGRWENIGTDARSRLDLYLADDSQTWDHVMTWRADGSNVTRVGINTTTPSATLDVNGQISSGAITSPKLNVQNGAYEGSIVFGSNDSWHCGIRQHDDADAEMRIWHKNSNGMIFLATGYDGEPASISRPTDGLVVQGNNVGIGNFSSVDPSQKLHVKTTSDVSMRLDGDTSQWAGIEWRDVNGTNYQWFNGSTATWSFGGGGSSSNTEKRIHAHGGVSIGAGLRNTTVPTNGLGVEGGIAIGSTTVIDSSRNIIGAAAHFTSTYGGGTGDFTNVTTPQIKIQTASGFFRIPHLSAHASVSGVFNFETGKDVYWGEPTDTGHWYFRGRDFEVHDGDLTVDDGVLKMGTATVIDSSRNATFALVEGTGIGVDNTSSTSKQGLSLYNGSGSSVNPDYGIMFTGTSGSGTHGSVTGDWATYLTMDSSAGRGWIFKTQGVANVASISNTGNATFNHLFAKQGTFTHTDHNYVSIEASINKEQMVRFKNSATNYWYAGIRTNAGIASTADFHIYSTALGDDAFALTTSGDLVAKRNLNTKTGDIQINGQAVIDSGRNVIAASFRPNVDNRWKIRGNSANANLAFEYSTSSGLSDANIKFELTPSRAELNGDLVFTKSPDPRIYAGTNVGLNIDGQALYLNRNSNSNILVGSGSAPATLSGLNVHMNGSSYVLASDGTRSAFMGADSSNYAMFGSLTNHPAVIRANNNEVIRANTNRSVEINYGGLTVGSSQLENVTLEVNATNTAGAPGTTAAILIKGYEGRGIGTFYEDISYSGEWFTGLQYSGGFSSFNIGYSASGGQAEYSSKAIARFRANGDFEMGTTVVIDAARNAEFSGSVKVQADGTYSGYGAIGFGGVSNGSNRVFGHSGTGDGLFLTSAAGHGIYLRPNGGSDGTSRFTVTNLGHVVLGGSPSNNAHTSIDSTRLMFGGGNTDAQNNYYIGTNKENVGGNYTKLDLRWHTGIRMGAQATYGGIRFFNNEDLTTLLFSIGRGDTNTRVESGNLYISNGSLYAENEVEARGGIQLRRDQGQATGISFYNNAYHNWQTYMASQGVTGCGPNANLTAPVGLAGVTSWALRSRMEGVATYGWIWETGSSGGGGATATAKMSLHATTGNLQIAGSFTAGANITAYSDERLKDNIKTLDGRKVLEMRGVSFTKDGKAGSGVIAQELERTAPELVEDDGTYKSVAYGNLVGYLIENAKQQQSEIDELKTLVKKLLEK